mmetsp:Transcript_32579/g.52831  ORF Transcript_32579/g.52831 Transcript_32579/m.52831 type:complete len:224 (-) Transcript_32579:1544-2215(-)
MLTIDIETATQLIRLCLTTKTAQNRTIWISAILNDNELFRAVHIRRKWQCNFTWFLYRRLLLLRLFFLFLLVTHIILYAIHVNARFQHLLIVFVKHVDIIAIIGLLINKTQLAFTNKRARLNVFTNQINDKDSASICQRLDGDAVRATQNRLVLVLFGHRFEWDGTCQGNVSRNLTQVFSVVVFTVQLVNVKHNFGVVFRKILQHHRIRHFVHFLVRLKQTQL